MGKLKEKGYTHAKADARKFKRQHEADVRQAKYDSLTLAEKIKLVQSRGGSKRELARLMNPPAKKAAVSSPPAVVAPVVATAEEAPKKKRTPKSKVNRAAKSAKPSKS